MKPTPKPSTRAPRPFPRRLPRVPTQVQRSAELWLEFYLGFAGQLIQDVDGVDRQLVLLDRAALLANKALELFEERWPGVKL